MVKVTIQGKEFYMDGVFKENLDRTKTTIRKDWDYVFCVDGEVGAGKSWFAIQMAYYCSDGNFDLTKICFTPQQFKEAILSADKYSAVIMDEAFRGLSARGSMTATNQAIISMLQEIRQKNLYVFIVAPSVWDIDRYIALHRCKGVFHIYTGKGKERGFFRFYSSAQLKALLTNFKMRYKYFRRPKFAGRFTKFFPLNEEEYKKKKWDALGNVDVDKSKNPTTIRVAQLEDWIAAFSQELKMKLGYTDENLGNLMARSKDIIKEMRIKCRKRAVNTEIIRNRGLNAEIEEDGGRKESSLSYK